MERPVPEKANGTTTSRQSTSKMLYKIRFKAGPKEIIFELRQKKSVSVRDVIRTMNDNFKNMNFEVTLDSKTLDERENVKYGRIYILKCRLPVKTRKKKTFYV